MNAPPDQKIGFEHKGIGLVLAHHRLTVPLNQREYSWEAEHVNDLLTDLGAALIAGRGYFLGTIVLTGGGDLPEVSDGQQRLATTTILLAAVRDYFQGRGEKARVRYIEDTFLSSIDPRTTQTEPKLRLNVDDNEFFTNFVVAAPDSKARLSVKPTKDSHKRIKAAADLAAEYLRKLIEPHQEAARVDRLIELMEFVRDRAQVIALRVPDHMNAFMMFETLNDRGLKASQADLLKNHLLSQLGDRISAGQQKWARMLGILESLGRGDITVTYLHHLLITKYGPTREREVFDKVRQTINNQLRAIEFLDELADAANDYAALFNSDHKKWNEYGTTMRNNIATTNRDLRVEQIRPLMFAVARKFTPAEARIAFRLFVFWSVRFLVVGGRGGLLDRNYAIASQKIGSGAIKSAAALAQELKDILPSDTIFETAFAEARLSQNYLARYYLRALERQVRGEAEPEYVPMDEENVINLEHVLPENPSATWSHVDADTAAAYYKRIGNLVLLQAKTNSLIGNNSYDEKKPALLKSGFTLTSDMAQNTTWGPKEIAERQQWLAKLAVKTWPLQ